MTLYLRKAVVFTVTEYLTGIDTSTCNNDNSVSGDEIQTEIVLYELKAVPYG